MTYKLGSAIADAVTGNLNILPKEESDKRYAICKACPHYNALKKCNLCGCFMPVKTKLRKATCPAKKW